MSIVSNTGPLIALSKADCVGLLKPLFGAVRIPPAVQRELLAKVGAESQRLEAAMAEFIQVSSPRALATRTMELTDHLGPGEQQAIALAVDSQMALVIDERLGRSAARQLGVQITGTAGVLIQAKHLRLIDGVVPILEQIRRNGYWLSDELLRTAASLAGE